MTQHFGEHLTIDGYDGDEQLLDSRDAVLLALSELVTLLGMRTLAEPQVYRAESNEIKDPGGWTGIVVLVESHISIHTFPKRGFVSADVYTCKNGMDKDLVVSYLQRAFELKDVETNFINRGTKYPKENIYL